MKIFELTNNYFSNIPTNVTYDINGFTSGDFDGDGKKDDLAVVARINSDTTKHYRYSRILLLCYNENNDKFELKYEYIGANINLGYSFLGITSGKFMSPQGKDDIAVITSSGDSNPQRISKILIFSVFGNTTNPVIGYPRFLPNLNYDIRHVDTNPNYNTNPTGYDSQGNPITYWRHDFYRLNALTGVDIDGDGKDEMALIVRKPGITTRDKDYYKVLIPMNLITLIQVIQFTK